MSSGSPTVLPMVNQMDQNKYRAPIDKKRTILSTKGPILGSYSRIDFVLQVGFFRQVEGGIAELPPSMKALLLLKLEAVLYLLKIL